MRITLFLLTISLLTACRSTDDNTDLRIMKLTCEYSVNPVNIDTPHPCFSWTVQSSIPENTQTAYRIVIAGSKDKLEQGDDLLWDSGKRISGKNIHVKYEGKPLKSNSQYFYKVTVWDKDNNSAVSDIALFATALLNKDDWKARWIGFNEAPEPVPSKGFYKNPKEGLNQKDTVHHIGRSVLLRKGFEIVKQVKSARLFVTGLGFYEAEINGKRIGNHLLSPAKTPYHKYVLYDTYDVTGILKNGRNAIGLHLGNGWYNPYKKWWDDYRMQWFGYKKAIAQLMITYTDGTEEMVVTGNSWKKHSGPVMYSCVYDGEVYDANAEIPGWSSPGFDDARWDNAVEMRAPAPELVSAVMPPIRVVDTLNYIKVTEPKKNIKIFDFGQNFAGWVKVRLKGKKGTKITIRFSEELSGDGTLDLTCNENALATAQYTLRGGDAETYEPHFTYFGFQYVQVSADGEMPGLIHPEGCVIHSGNEPAGEFECSYPLINKMHHAAVWSQKSNMIGYPMDCPQRDERLGWMGDAQVTAEEAMFNFDMALFYKNWFRGIRANQDEKTGDIPIISPRPYIWDEGIEWSSSYFTMVWQFYLYYGDRQVLAENYPAMQRYMQFLKNLSKDHILPQGWIGDWGSMVQGWNEGEPESVPTAFYFYDAVTLSKIAALLGKEEESKQYNKLAGEIKEKYNDTYFDEKTKNYNDGSQMANAFPLFLGIVPDEYEKDVLKNIIDDIKKNDTHLTTGVLGTKYLFETLMKYDRNDIAWSLATQTTYPSWAEMMKKYNTMCEFWTLKQSHNHVMMGSIDSWFYKAIAGIRPLESAPAFKKLIIKPYPAAGLDSVKASTHTIRGKIVSQWKKTPGGINMHVEIPFNTTALVYVPDSKGKMIFCGNKKITGSSLIKVQGNEDNYTILEVGSGKYDLQVK